MKKEKKVVITTIVITTLILSGLFLIFKDKIIGESGVTNPGIYTNNIEITTNLKNTGYVKISLKVQAIDNKQKEHLENSELYIRDYLIGLMCGKERSEILDNSNYDILKEEIKEGIEERLKTKILGVYVQELVVQ